jgi:large subunit ribosomal protein L18
MKKSRLKQHQKSRRAHRVRARIQGTPERPRMSVHRSIKHIGVQLIDDTTGTTLGMADDRDEKGTKTEKAAAVGKKIADIAKSKGVTTVVFDRGSTRYHGRVKALAETAREAGLKF